MSVDKKKGICVGSFDPVTVGHLDLFRRASALFDEVIVCVMINENKHPLFNLDQRVAFLQEALQDLPNVRIASYQGLAVDFAQTQGAGTLIKGLRNGNDFEYENTMNYYNRRLAPELETVYLGTAPEYVHISSSAVRELLSFDGDISGLIPANIEAMVKSSYQEKIENRII